MALGHRDIETTQRYAHFVQSMLDDAVAETTGDLLLSEAAPHADAHRVGEGRGREESTDEGRGGPIGPREGDGPEQAAGNDSLEMCGRAVAELPDAGSAHGDSVLYEQCTAEDGEELSDDRKRSESLRYARSDSNGRHSASKADALSS